MIKVLNTELYNFLPKELSLEILIKYFNQTIGEGDYHSLDSARNIINLQQDIPPGMKMKLINHLKLINQKKNIWTAKELFGNNRLFNSYVKKLRGIGINPITIPRNRGVSILPNLKNEIIGVLTH